MSGRKRGRPRKEYQIRVRAERRREIDFPKLARALLEQAAAEQHRRSADPGSQREPDQSSDGKGESS